MTKQFIGIDGSIDECITSGYVFTTFENDVDTENTPKDADFYIYVSDYHKQYEDGYEPKLLDACISWNDLITDHSKTMGRLGLYQDSDIVSIHKFLHACQSIQSYDGSIIEEHGYNNWTITPKHIGHDFDINH